MKCKKWRMKYGRGKEKENTIETKWGKWTQVDVKGGAENLEKEKKDITLGLNWE